MICKVDLNVRRFVKAEDLGKTKTSGTREVQAGSILATGYEIPSNAKAENLQRPGQVRPQVRLLRAPSRILTLQALLSQEHHAPPVHMGEVPGKPHPLHVLYARLSHVLRHVGRLQGRVLPEQGDQLSHKGAACGDDQEPSTGP